MRAIERLGEVLTELRHAPDPRVLVEVALVQLASAPPASAGDDIAPLAARVAALEEALATGRVPAPTRRRTGRPLDRPHPARRAGPAGRRRQRADRPARAGAGAPRRRRRRRRAVATSDDLEAGWERLKPTLKGMARAVFTPVDVVAAAGDTITLAAPNATHLAKCREHVGLVEQACADALGRPITIELVVKDAPTPAASAPPAPPDEDIDLDDLVDAPAGSAPTTLDRLAEAFPGSELVERDR